MKIAILTSGVLPVPAVQGGAVENLVDFYLEYNDKHKLHDITVFSIFHPDIVHHNALLSGVNHYHYIDTTSTIAKIKKRLFRLVHGDNGYYYYSVEFFLSQAIKEIRALIEKNKVAYRKLANK